MPLHASPERLRFCWSDRPPFIGLNEAFPAHTTFDTVNESFNLGEPKKLPLDSAPNVP